MYVGTGNKIPQCPKMAKRSVSRWWSVIEDPSMSKKDRDCQWPLQSMTQLLSQEEHCHQIRWGITCKMCIKSSPYSGMLISTERPVKKDGNHRIMCQGRTEHSKWLQAQVENNCDKECTMRRRAPSCR